MFNKPLPLGLREIEASGDMGSWLTEKKQKNKKTKKNKVMSRLYHKVLCIVLLNNVLERN